MELTSLSLSFEGKITNETAKRVIDAARNLVDQLRNEDANSHVELGYSYENGGNNET